MTTPTHWPTEYARVISCQVCTRHSDASLLRDDEENVPQPGYVGVNYLSRRVLLVGQNPATPKSLAERDKTYTAALRALRDEPTDGRLKDLEQELVRFIPKWPVHGTYFPLKPAGLALSDIAYFNLVRCRTVSDKRPASSTVRHCTSAHWGRWLDLLQPRVVVFIGKWAAGHGAAELEARRIPHAFMNRQRSLSSADRAANVQEVIHLVRATEV